MKKFIKKFLEIYYSLPDCSLSAAFIGCEVSAIFSLAAIVMLNISHTFSDTYYAMSLADTFGTAGQRTLVLGFMFALALGITDKVMELRKNRM